jgi:hypothetical protein
MSTITLLRERLGFAGRLPHWWRVWSKRPSAEAGLDPSDSAKMKFAARNGYPIDSVLPGKWPDKHVIASEHACGLNIAPGRANFARLLL